MYDLSQIMLQYLDEDGTIYTQPLSDITEAGTLTDPDTGDDLELAGWRFDQGNIAEINNFVAGKTFGLDAYEDSEEEVDDPEGQPILETFDLLREIVATSIDEFLRTR